VEKADLSKGYQDPKTTLGASTHFSEIIELKFGNNLPYILSREDKGVLPLSSLDSLYLNAFLELWLLNYL